MIKSFLTPNVSRLQIRDFLSSNRILIVRKCQKGKYCCNLFSNRIVFHISPNCGDSVPDFASQIQGLKQEMINNFILPKRFSTMHYFLGSKFHFRCFCLKFPQHCSQEFFSQKELQRGFSIDLISLILVKIRYIDVLIGKVAAAFSWYDSTILL